MNRLMSLGFVMSLGLCVPAVAMAAQDGTGARSVAGAGCANAGVAVVPQDAPVLGSAHELRRIFVGADCTAELSPPALLDWNDGRDGRQLAGIGVSDAPAQPADSQVSDGATTDLAASGPARPQLAQAAVEAGQTVRGRPRPDYEPLGVRAGSFIISPELAVTEQFEDNVFRTDSNRKADLISIVSPNVAVNSDWARHAVFFESGADVAFYIDNTDEDYQDYFGTLGGRLDIFDDSYVSLDVGARHGHQGRGDPDDVGAIEPTVFNAYTGGLTGYHGFGMFNVTLDNSVTRLDYFDDTTAGGPTGVTGEINNDDRDRTEYDHSLRVGYEIVPDYEAFLRGGFNVIDYLSSTDDAGIDRDSYGYDIVAGIAIDFTGLIFGDFYAGYLQQFYDDSALSDISGVNFGADITWNVTALTTIIGSLSREVRQTALVGSSGRFVTAAGVQVDHELLRNLIIGLSVDAEQDDFEGIDRTDYNLTGGVTVDYFLNRNVFFGAGYEYGQRISDGTDNDYVVNTAFVRGGARF